MKVVIYGVAQALVYRNSKQLLQTHQALFIVSQPKHKVPL